MAWPITANFRGITRILAKLAQRGTQIVKWHIASGAAGHRIELAVRSAVYTGSRARCCGR